MNRILFSILIILFSFSPSFGQKTSIMSFNIRYDNEYDKENNWQDRREDVVKVIIKHQASIIGIQEALINQLAYIDSSLTNYTYIGVGREDGKEKGEFSPIFYDSTIYEVILNSTFWLSKTPDTVSVGWDAALERICSYGLIQHRETEEKLWVFNTHFDHIGKKARINSARLILQKIEEVNTKNYPVLLMGDLNSTPKEKPVRIIKKSMDDASELATESDGDVTFNGFRDEGGWKRIDYIFVIDIQLESYNVIEEKKSNDHFISDHFPIVIRIK